MAKYTNIAVALGNQSGNGSSKTFTFSASSINSLVNNTLPSECKITRAVIQFRGAKPYSLSGKGSITITLGSYSKSYSDVIANDGTNDDFGSGDTLCTSDDIKGYINSNGRFNSDLIFKLGSSTLSTYWRVEATIYFDYETPYTVSFGTETGGSVNTYGGFYYSGTNVSVTATPNTGYKFVKWSDGNTSATRTVTVTGNASYTAQFEPIYVSYDSVFSFKHWRDNGIGEGNGIGISNLTDTGFTGTAKVDDAYTTECRPLIPVEIGKEYTIEFEANGGGFELFVFNCDANGAWGSSNPMFTMKTNTKKFNFVAVTNYVSIRCDVVGTGTVVNFSNFRIYPADCPYMSNSVSSADRTDATAWSMPTPVRKGYTFKGWNTKPNGSGTTYTSRSTFPSSDLILYSQWEVAKYTVNFRNQDGSVVKTNANVEHGTTLGTLPTVSRSGYTFAGWIPCEPAKKSDGTVLDSYKYNGDNAYPLDKKYKYTDKLSVHIEAYMSNWEDIASLKAQIISCTEGGGWGLGYQANSSGHGTELYAGGYKGIDLELGTAGKFSNNTWYLFDIVFSNGTFEAYVNGTKKGTQTTANTAISYNSENTIFVGAEAAKSATTPGGNYFKGHISNVFIANKGTRLAIATTNTVVEGDIDYYPVWRLNPTYTITASGENGTVTGGGTYEHGSSVTLTATANKGYKFKQWSDGVTSATRTVTVMGDATYTAVFELIPPEIKSVQMIYLDKQISATNKVPCGEGFIISVELS